MDMAENDKITFIKYMSLEAILYILTVPPTPFFWDLLGIILSIYFFAVVPSCGTQNRVD